MLTVNAAHEVNGVIVPKCEEQLVCSSCGYDLDEQEVKANTCADCGAPLILAQHMRIYATSVPSAQGTTLS